MNNEEPASRLREILATMGREIALLPDGTSAGTTNPLHDLYAKLVTQLALGPEPELRTCPNCRRSGMAGAKVCGFCWMKLEPLPRAAATS